MQFFCADTLLEDNAHLSLLPRNDDGVYNRSSGWAAFRLRLENSQEFWLATAPCHRQLDRNLKNADFAPLLGAFFKCGLSLIRSGGETQSQTTALGKTEF